MFAPVSGQPADLLRRQRLGVRNATGQHLRAPGASMKRFWGDQFDFLGVDLGQSGALPPGWRTGLVGARNWNGDPVRLQLGLARLFVHRSSAALTVRKNKPESLPRRDPKGWNGRAVGPIRHRRCPRFEHPPSATLAPWRGTPSGSRCQWRQAHACPSSAYPAFPELVE